MRRSVCRKLDKRSGTEAKIGSKGFSLRGVGKAKVFTTDHFHHLTVQRNCVTFPLLQPSCHTLPTTTPGGDPLEQEVLVRLQMPDERANTAAEASNTHGFPL